jgi:hypothetical protein
VVTMSRKPCLLCKIPDSDPYQGGKKLVAYSTIGE